MIPNNGAGQYRANYAYSQYSVVNEMASHYRVNLNPNGVAGMPQDTFRRSNTLISARYLQPVDSSKVWWKKIGSFVSDIADLIGVVGMFAPPLAAVAAIASPIGSMAGMAANQIDVTPHPVQVTTVGRYNYWFR